MATPTSSSTSEPPSLKGKEKAYEEENDGRPSRIREDPSRVNPVAWPQEPVERRVLNHIKGKILDGQKLKHSNKDKWFFSLKNWAISNGVHYIISDTTADANRRRMEVGDPTFEAANAAVINSIFISIEEDDQEAAQQQTLASELVRELEKKYQKVLKSTSQEY
jgi:hypothetical protein